MVAKGGTKGSSKEPALAVAIEKARVEYLESLKARHRIPRQFVDGVVRGFGIAVGGTIVFGIVIYFLSRFIVIPQAQELLENVQSPSATFQQSFSD